MRFRAHWGEEDIRAMIREELTAPPHLERMRDMVQTAVHDVRPVLPPTPPRRWWRDQHREVIACQSDLYRVNIRNVQHGVRGRSGDLH